MSNFFKNIKNYKYLFIINLLYFLLGFVNIHFALLGLICMAVPIYLLIKTNKKTYCQGYCPRANLYSKAGKITNSYSLKTPNYFINGNMKWIMLVYFGISLIFITVSTVKVSTGLIPSMEKLRYLIIFTIPFEMFQLIEVNGIMPWITHLSYRFYSMMLTTTSIGFILSFIYKPRAWCTICPISTISQLYIKKINLYK